MWDNVPFSTAYFDRQPDGSFIQLLGRWSDWMLPAGSFGNDLCVLDGTPVPALSVSGMLAMKEQFLLGADAIGASLRCLPALHVFDAEESESFAGRPCASESVTDR